MLKKSLYLVLVAIVVTVATFTGCCNSAEDYFESDNNIITSAHAEVIDGELQPLKTQDGTSVTAEKGTFSSKAVIYIIEKAFTGQGSDYLDNTDKIYELRGILKSENPSVKDIEITNAEKPINVTLRSSFSDNVEARYVGIREKGQSDWSFTCVDKIGGQSSTRAYLSGSDIVYQTNRLGIEIALFAKIAGSEKLQFYSTVSDVDITVEPEDRSSENPVPNKIRISSGCYDDNMKVFAVPAGNGLDNLNTSDFVAELTYMNNDGSDNLKVAGIDAIYQQPTKRSGTGDNYVHKIQIRNLSGNSDKLNFLLNTKGVNVDDFPMDFNVVIKNSNRLRHDTLPFDYSDNVKIEELKGPKPPVDIAVSSEKIMPGETITITWKPGDDVASLTYDLLISRNGEDEAAVAENISETAWTSSDGEKALKEGSYRFRVLVRDSNGYTNISGYHEFSVVTPSEQPEVPSNVRALPSEVRYGNTVTITWDAVENIKYNVYLTRDSIENKVAENLSEGAWTSPEGAEALPIASYAARIEAVNEFNLTSSATPVEFQVVTAEGPGIPVINPLAKAGYLAGEPVIVSWNAVQDPRQKTVSYNLWLYNSEPAETPTASNISSTEYTFNYLATGTYFVRVAATNGEDVSQQSEPASFAVVIPAVATLDASRCTVYACDYYEASPEFIVKFNENNVDEETVKNAVSVANVDAAKVSTEKQSDGFHIKFTEPLPLNQNFTVSMGAMKDIYGYDVTPFSDVTFKTIPFEGLGTEESPFMLDVVEAVQMTSDSKLPLIGSLTAEVTCFPGMTFANAAIIADSTLVDTAQAAEWKGLSAVNVADNAVVGIPNNRKWLADANGSVYMTFTGSLNGKNHYFKTAPKEITTENGLTITLGNGSSETPYFVYTPQQLNEIRDHLDSAYTFCQMRDIDLADYTSAGTGWSPIGDDTNSFTGVYDGCGRTISNIRVVPGAPSIYYIGLFGVISGENSIVKNLSFDGVLMEFPASSIGVIAGKALNKSNIENCHVKSAVVRNYSSGNTGGLVGAMDNGHIYNSDYEGQVICVSGGYGGGILGYPYSSVEFADCYTKGSLDNENGTYTGGVCACFGHGASVVRCSVEMDLSGKEDVGGICGRVDGNSVIFEDCYTSGNFVTMVGNIGGIVGNFQPSDASSFTRCRIEGTINSLCMGLANYVGGVTGYLNCSGGVDFVDCSVRSDIIAKENGWSKAVGGIIGWASTNHNFTRCSFNATFDTSNAETVGGLVGFSAWGSATNAQDCYAKFENMDCKYIAGGIGGQLYGSGNFERCFAKFSKIENAIGTSDCQVGGFIGVINGTLNCSCCYTEFDTIIGLGNRKAGFCAYPNSGNITNCYAKGNKITVTQPSGSLQYVGGFTGQNSYSVVITNCYSTAELELNAASFNSCGLLVAYDSKCNSSFTTAASTTVNIFGDYVTSANCYTLPAGYDSSKDWGEHPWDPAVWNLEDGAFPTLKNMPQVQ